MRDEGRRDKKGTRGDPGRRVHRRSLTSVGGPVALEGTDELERAALVRALDVAGDDDASRAHVHGFHSYPARLHPSTARRLVDALSPRGGRILDPFMGSGTVLVEGRIAGRSVVGVDANPLAVELAWLKTRGASDEERKALLVEARSVVLAADRRRERKAGATHRYGPEDVALFDPHVLLELDGLNAGLRSVENPWARRALSLVLSSILVKVSRQPGDTSRARGERRLAGGFAIHFFQQKANELEKCLAAFQRLVTDQTEPLTQPSVHLGDARRLDRIPDASIDLIVTSPPYPGTYDYLAHHASRLRWLGLDTTRFAEIELGARRHLEPLTFGAALARFSSDLGACLSSMARVLKPTGRAVLILADSVVHERAVYVDKLSRDLARPSRLVVTTIGSQQRPHFHGPSARAFDRGPRREHAIVCRRMP